MAEVVLVPALRVADGLEHLIRNRLPVRQWDPPRVPRGDGDDPVETLRMKSGKQCHQTSTHRKSGGHTALGLGGIQHCDGVCDDLLGRVTLDNRGAVRVAIAHRVVGDDSEVTGQIWDLHLPMTGVTGLPCLGEENRRPLVLVDLVVDLRPVAIDEPVRIWVSSPHGLPPLLRS